MTDRTREEHTMKRTAAIVGVIAALAVPSVASAGNMPAQAKLQVKPQVSKALVARAQIAHVQVSRVQVAKLQRVVAARVTVSRATAYRISLLRTAR
jgi:hypothetical protein